MRQTAAVIIDRPAQEVFDYVIDIQNDAVWRTGVVEAAYTSEPPLGVGTTGFDRVSANGRDMVAEWTTIEYQPGQFARWGYVSGPLQGFGGYVCESTGDGTRFVIEANVKPTGPLRLLGPIFGMVLRRQIHADVSKLKTILEN